MFRKEVQRVTKGDLAIEEMMKENKDTNGQILRDGDKAAVDKLYRAC